MFTALAGAQPPLGTGATTAPPPPAPSDDFLLATADAYIWPTMRGAAVALGQPVDRHGAPIEATARSPKGGTFLVRCRLLYSRGQNEAATTASPPAAG